MADRFSIVIPTRNRAAIIDEAVRRLAALHHAPDEIIVVDDGSTDDTADRVRSLGAAILVSGQSRGPAHARNLGADVASGDWLIFLDDDDPPDADWMTSFRSLARLHPQADYLSVGYRNKRGASVSEVRPSDMGAAFGHAVACYLGGAFAIRRSLFWQVTGFDSRLRHMEFTDLALRVFDDTRCVRTAHDNTALLTRIVRPTRARESQDPGLLVNSALLVLEKSAHRWRRDRIEYANQLATVGVAAYRAGRHSTGRRLLVDAAMRNPKDLTHLGRAAVSFLPPLAERAWKLADWAEASRELDRESAEQASELTVSVIIPSYGRQKLLLEAIDSVLAQSHPLLQCIVVDDGSPTPLEVPDDPRIDLVRTANSGLAAARNRGLQEATGQYVFFLDDDDRFTRNRIARALRTHLRVRADIVVCGQSWADGSGGLDRDLSGDALAHVLESTTPNMGAVSVRRSYCPRFDERFVASQDLEWWIRAAETMSVASTGELGLLMGRHSGHRHLNGTNARIEWSHALMDLRADYFTARPRATSFRRSRLSHYHGRLGDTVQALSNAVLAARSARTRTSLGVLARSGQSHIRSLLAENPATVLHEITPIAMHHLAEWHAPRTGPADARWVAVRRSGRFRAEVNSLWPRVAQVSQRNAPNPHEIRWLASRWGTVACGAADWARLRRYHPEWVPTIIWARILESGALAMDVGAANGWFTAVAASVVGPEGQVVAIEDNVELHQLLHATVAANPWKSRVRVATDLEAADVASVLDAAGRHREIIVRIPSRFTELIIPVAEAVPAHRLTVLVTDPEDPQAVLDWAERVGHTVHAFTGRGAMMDPEPLSGRDAPVAWLVLPRSRDTDQRVFIDVAGTGHSAGSGNNGRLNNWSVPLRGRT